MLDVDIDGKMSVDVAHLVLEAFGDADDQVVDDGPDGAEGSDGLALAMVDFDRDGVLLRPAEAHGEVRKVLDQFACETSDESVFFFNFQFPVDGYGLRGAIERCTLVSMDC